VLAPDAIIEDEYKNLADPAIGADYILITHRDLGWDVNRDFDEFSYGITAPEAILDFLAYAYSSWTPPAPQYVLIVGDSTRNPKNNPDPWFGVDTVTTYLPTYLTVTDHMGETATDEWFVRVSGDDAISDLYIGRLPAKSVTEAGVMVNKILAYEGSLNTKSWEKNVLFLADDQRDGPEYEYEAVFEIMNNDAAALLPAAMNDPITGYLNDYFDADNLKAEIIAQINSGRPIAVCILSLSAWAVLVATLSTRKTGITPPWPRHCCGLKTKGQQQPLCPQDLPPPKASIFWIPPSLTPSSTRTSGYSARQYLLPSRSLWPMATPSMKRSTRLFSSSAIRPWLSRYPFPKNLKDSALKGTVMLLT
jgi:hypothetical protein